MRKQDLYLISPFDLIVGFYCEIVDMDTPRFGCLLNFVACGIFNSIHQEFIDTQGLLPTVGRKGIMLIERFVLVLCFHYLPRFPFPRTKSTLDDFGILAP